MNPLILQKYKRLYGIYTGYIRGIYGVNLEEIREQKGERTVWIIMLIAILPEITKQQLADNFGVSVSTIEKTMQILRKDKIIQREGSAKTGKWLIRKLQ